MTRPLDIIAAAHNAFRTDIAAIDAAAPKAAQGGNGLGAIVERFQRMNEVLTWHADGEEAGIFPVLETVAPDVVRVYEIDHQGLDAAFETISAAVTAHDPIRTARATAAFKFHLDLHLLKEDQHLYVPFEQRLGAPDQAKAVGGLASAVPGDRFSDFVSWLFPLIGDQDRRNVLGYWQSVMPPDFYARAARLADAATSQALGSDLVTGSPRK